MTAAFVTDCLSSFVYGQIQKLVDHTVCVFLPEDYNGSVPSEISVRRYTRNFDVAAFQRYDIVLFCVQSNWDPLLSFIEDVKGVVILTESSPSYDKLSKLTEYLADGNCDLNAYVSNLPKHIHWTARNEREIMSRVEAFGLLTPKFKQNYEKVYGVKLER